MEEDRAIIEWESIKSYIKICRFDIWMCLYCINMIQSVVRVPGQISSEKYVCRCLLEGAQALIVRSFQMDHMWLLGGLRQKSKRNCLTVVTSNRY